MSEEERFQMTGHPYGRWAGILLIVFSVFASDLLTKLAALSNLSQGQSIPILPNVFHLTLVLNRGAAFGLFSGQTAFFSGLSVITVVFILFYVLKNGANSSVLTLPLGLILGGAIGNLSDRIRLGYVIDFIDLRIWPVFNVADSAITIGAALLVWDILSNKRCIRSCSK